jgi:hypothetical protein
MPIPTHSTRENRAVSRVRASLRCQFNFEGLVHDAYVTNISLNGAFLLSDFIPQEKSQVVITLGSPLLKNTFTLDSEVVRTERVLKDGVDGFAVRFSATSLDLIELVKGLASQPYRVNSKSTPDKSPRVSAPAPR